jgi:hypothetical protein
VKGAPSIISLIRSMSYDAATKQLVSYPVDEYENLRNATYVGVGVDKPWPLTTGMNAPIPVPVCKYKIGI